eukprot:CAMPEP_0184506248 /NCGR_PEP_ID=MMETSP0113_2-20130426/53404_1 /TAXON_ID=91329 /ORGANISM="Norrisiella sphaerica, Strain BC52" /LENGTH=46 /DNA_ID= /DNA_START= /DNA_END= /DNA_ORIENTATION=
MAIIGASCVQTLMTDFTVLPLNMSLSSFFVVVLESKDASIIASSRD